VRRRPSGSSSVSRSAKAGDDDGRLHLFNTMSQKKEPLLKTAPDGPIRLFVCGPTVQGYIHVGHARTYVFYDVLARYLAHLGFQVNFLINITDVDDRITEAAKKEGTSPQGIAEKYTAAYLEDLRALKVDSVTSFQSVSKYIPVMIDQVATLVQRGNAYLADGVVYFDTSKYPYYGRLSHQSKSELSLRPLELTPNKKNLLDFSLWRPVILEEGKWDSPWGRGSPGWHIEDTAVTLTNFGPQYDIHGGAYELIYPHHEAELAQGESLTGIRPLVKYWVHTGLVNLSGRKMSKTAGNTRLVRELLRRYSADQLRHYLLSWHYRDDVEFSIPKLERAGRAFDRLLARAAKVKARASSDKTVAREDGEDEEVEDGAAERTMLSRFSLLMNDDVDTPGVIEWVEDDLIGGRDSASSSSSSPADAAARCSVLRVVSDVLGVDFLAKT
jgi:cysteinyl-tRNA synthetase